MSQGPVPLLCPHERRRCCLVRRHLALAEAISRDFGSFEAMKARLSAASVAVQGSGWGWLGFNKETGQLQIAACPNQVR